MTLKNYLFIMGMTTVFIWGIFLAALNIINPETASWLGLTLFYLSLFLAVSGTAAIIGFLIRIKVLKHELVFNLVKTAFRQSFMFAGLIVSILFLLAQNLFTWMNLILLIFILAIIEFIFISYKQTKV